MKNVPDWQSKLHIPIGNQTYNDAPGGKDTCPTMVVVHEIVVFFLRYVEIAFASWTFKFRRHGGIALAFAADAAQLGSSLGRFPNVREAAARAKPKSAILTYRELLYLLSPDKCEL